MTVQAAIKEAMTAEEFFLWSDTWEDGERYELVEGVPLRLQSERINHAETKLAVVIALRDGLRAARLDACRTFIDGVSVRISERTVREPDAVIHCGPYDGEDRFARNPVVVVEVVSPSSEKTDLTRKLFDYFAVSSILHYLIVFDDGRVLHHRRRSADGEIVTAIIGRDDVIDLSPPGFRVAVAAFFDDGSGVTPDI